MLMTMIISSCSLLYIYILHIHATKVSNFYSTKEKIGENIKIYIYYIK